MWCLCLITSSSLAHRHLGMQRRHKTTTPVALASSFRWTIRRAAPWEGKSPEQIYYFLFLKTVFLWVTDLRLLIFQSVRGEVPAGEVQAGLSGAQRAVRTSQEAAEGFLAQRAAVVFITFTPTPSIPAVQYISRDWNMGGSSGCVMLQPQYFNVDVVYFKCQALL